jgi:hypothetical protein
MMVGLHLALVAEVSNGATRDHGFVSPGKMSTISSEDIDLAGKAAFG